MRAPVPKIQQMSTVMEEGMEILELGWMGEEDTRELEKTWAWHERYRMWREDCREHAWKEAARKREKDEQRYRKKSPPPLPNPRRRRA